MAALEWEARLYNAAGTRIRMPLRWIESVDFEIGENGGCLNGSVKLLVPWETLQLTGSERVDVWLWGVLQYRGWVRMPQGDLAVPESKTLSLQGLMQTLRGYLVRRNFAYVASTDIGDVFRDLVNAYAIRTGRLPSLQLDTTGVAPLNLTMTTFDATGRDLAEALNDLVNTSPGSLIWGCDVDSLGRDRAYLRPRSQAVKYKYSVGDNVQAFVYPLDTTQVVNAVIVTGGEMLYPNLAKNPSFEMAQAPGETTSNLLQSPSWEDASGGSIPHWTAVNGATSDSSFARQGSVSIVLDDNPTDPEGLFQGATLPALPAAVNWSVYARCPATEVWHLNTRLEILNGASAVLSTLVFGPTLVPADATWHRYFGTWLVPVTAGAVTVRITFFVTGDTGAHGLNIDDAALWFGQVLASDWQPGRSHLASFGTLDFRNQDIAAFDGDIVTKVTPVISGGGGYAQIDSAVSARIPVKSQFTYVFAAWFSGDVTNAPEVSLSCRGYTGGVEGGTIVESAHHTINTGRWTQVVYVVNVGLADALDLTIRFYNANPCYVDGVGFWENNLPASWFPDKDYYARVSVLDYAGSISSPAAASITNYGLREKAETNVNVIDQASLDAFAVGYFNAHAVPLVQGRLDLFGPAAALNLDGSVQLVNIPSEPPALFPSRVRYTIGENAIKISADIGNQRPDLALLLRQAAAQALL